MRRSALSLALGFTLASVAGAVMAQSAAGSIFGRAEAGQPIQIENLDTGTKREISADGSGRFSFTQLPTGRYRITSAGVSREAMVNVGTGTEVSFGAAASADATNLDRVEVVGTGAFNPIDVSSVESSTVFTAEQMSQLPVARDVTSVALLAPGAVRGDSGFGNVASFGGSSPAENGYYINGFDVTNLFNFLSYADLPFDAIAEQQVKTGGYGAEYGRSLGGIVSIVTKRGSNEWKGGASVYWNPEGLREHSRNVISRNPADLADGHVYSQYREDNQDDDFSYNVYGGGPIIKDRLFVFGLVEGVDDSYDRYYDDTSRHVKNTQPRGMVKLDWNITDNHLLEFTGISNRDKEKYVDYTNPNGSLYTGEHGEESARYTIERGGEIYTAKYTGHLTDNFTLSAQAGKLEITTEDRDPLLLGSEVCPRAFDSRTNPSQTVKIGCWNESVTFVRDPDAPKDLDKRDAYRLDGEWQIGDHSIRFGYDHEKFASQRAGQSYTGGIYYRYYRRAGDFNVNGVLVPAGTNYVRTWDYRSLSGNFEVINTAAYLEDSWQVTDDVLLYGGLRMEDFENFNAEGDTFAKSDSLLAPRVGFSWDINGDSTMKLFGNAGRYFIPIASNTSVRMSGGDNTAENFFFYDGNIDPVTGAPANGLGAQIGPSDDSAPVAPDSRTVSATNLDPMYQDEFILGFQQQLSANWTAGVRGIYRKVQNGMDDYCSHQPFQDWADDNGHANFDVNSLAGCVLVNPGRDLQLAVDLEGDGNLQQVSIPSAYFGMPRYKRSYKALDFFFERRFADDWYLQGSYTLAKSEGNVEGYVNSTLEQSDAGITQDFDNALFTDGTYGPLPNDRRHTVKLFGAYQLTEEWLVGGSFLLQSGRPLNCNGYIPLDDPRIGIDRSTFNNYAASSFYCRNAAGEDVLHNRGDQGRTPWVYNLDASVAYTPNWANKKLTLEMKVFNIFNIQRVTEYEETSAYGGNAAQAPDLNYLNVVNYQSPRSVLFSARYQF
ncbi:TonB-dependent receptor domain-containing protein [Lysobacter cavernae]|uniref:TonB-dependent receptor domain-containing protein n=1 Tax=Lysobacter cavernae TaxID=1685901 RepID=A0ABV7RJW4_9GAMM